MYGGRIYLERIYSDLTILLQTKINSLPPFVRKVRQCAYDYQNTLKGGRGNDFGVPGDGVSPSDHRIKKLDFKSSKQITRKQEQLRLEMQVQSY